MKESVVQKWVKDRLEEEFGSDIYMFKVSSGPYASRKGIPDLVMCIGGKFYAIEVKIEHGRLTELQRHELKKINAAGGYSFTIYGKDETIMKAFINHVRKENKIH